MNKKAKIAMVAGLCVLLAGATATHYAWQEGLIPTNVLAAHPRAPLPENFVAALRADSSIAKSIKPVCLRPHLASTRKLDHMGIPGLPHQSYPGWDMVSIAQVPGESGQRIDQLTQALDALAQAKLYTASETEHVDDSGARYGMKHYSLSLAGWKTMSEEQCFVVGLPRVAEIREFSRVLSDTGSSPLYEVKAAYKLDSLPPWIRNPGVQSLTSPSQLKNLHTPVIVTARLRRTETGWAVEPAQVDFPALGEDEVLDLITRSRVVPAPQACIKLPPTGGATGLEVQTAPYAITLYEEDARTDSGSAPAHRIMWQSRLAKLVGAGVFREEPVAADKAQNTPAGTRYVMDPEYQKWLDINDAQCLRMGEVSAELVDLALTPEVLQTSKDGKAARGVAKLLFRLEEEAWIEGLDLPLPEVEALRSAGGIPAIGHFTWTDRSEEKAWQLVNMLAPRPDLVPTPAQLAEAQRQMAAAQQLAMERDSRSAGAAQLASSALAFSPGVGVDVLWRPAHRHSSGSVSNAGLTVTYCCAGASSAALATRGIFSGKVYAEFTLTARTRNQKGDTYTSLGVVPGSVLDAGGEVFILDTNAATMAFQRGGEVAHNDVIGLAIDLDRNELHISRNGAWLSSAPGAGPGAPLKAGRPQYVTAVVSASSSAGGTDSWTANFGKSRFRFPIPPGYKSYDGRQRG